MHGLRVALVIDLRVRVAPQRREAVEPLAVLVDRAREVGRHLGAPEVGGRDLYLALRLGQRPLRHLVEQAEPGIDLP